MTYGLAKKLKDAGIHQMKLIGAHWKCANEITYLVETDRLFPVNGLLEADDTACRIPSLSELIEACGEDFGGISRSKKGEWIAYGITAATLNDAIGGTNPSEAVAHLWLALKTV